MGVNNLPLVFIKCSGSRGIQTVVVSINKQHYAMILLCAISLTYGILNVACEQAPFPPLPSPEKPDKPLLPPIDEPSEILTPHYLPSPPTETGWNEDQEIINETISKYGSPHDFKILGLPGPELAADTEVNLLNSKLNSTEPGVYTLRIRTITEYFSYNGRYEESRLKKMGKQEFPIIKGQFGEHFKRNSGGYYIRTIGYTLDESGYKQFLIDLSTAKTETQEVTPISGPLGGGPPGNKVTISSTALGSLIGGNSLG